LPSSWLAKHGARICEVMDALGIDRSVKSSTSESDMGAADRNGRPSRDGTCRWSGFPRAMVEIAAPNATERLIEAARSTSPCEGGIVPFSDDVFDKVLCARAYLWKVSSVCVRSTECKPGGRLGLLSGTKGPTRQPLRHSRPRSTTFQHSRIDGSSRTNALNVSCGTDCANGMSSCGRRKRRLRRHPKHRI